MAWWTKYTEVEVELAIANALAGGSADISGTSNTQLLFNDSGSVAGFARWTGSQLEIGYPNPTVYATFIGTPGSTFRAYTVVAHFADGTQTAGFSTRVFVLGSATLDLSNYVELDWSPVPNAINYSVVAAYRDGTPNTTGLLATVSGTTFSDTGIATIGPVDMGANTTGRLLAQSVGINDIAFGNGQDGTYSEIALGSASDNKALGITTTVNDIREIGTTLDTTFNGPRNASSIGFQITTSLSTESSPAGGGYAPLNILSSLYVNGDAPGGVWNAYLATPVFAGTVPEIHGLHIEIPQIFAGSVTTNQAIWVADQASNALTNSYYFWLDSRGVFRIREDHTFNSVGQAILALYNPQFAKYTPGAADHERIIMGQWNSNVAEIGTEKGGTGTLRKLRLIGAGLLLDATILPTSNPGAGQLWNDGNTVKVGT